MLVFTGREWAQRNRDGMETVGHLYVDNKQTDLKFNMYTSNVYTLLVLMFHLVQTGLPSAYTYLIRCVTIVVALRGILLFFVVGQGYRQKRFHRKGFGRRVLFYHTYIYILAYIVAVIQGYCMWMVRLIRVLLSPPPPKKKK